MTHPIPLDSIAGGLADPSDEPVRAASGPSWHSYLPWAWIRGGYRNLRSLFFTAPRHEGRYLRVRPPTGFDYTEGRRFASPYAANEARLTRLLGYQSFAPNWEFSYNKRGEMMNLARVVYEDDPGSDVEWWQYHSRGWPAAAGAIDLGCHWEPEPTEHSHAHFDGVGVDRERGMRELADVLDEAQVPFEEVTYDG